MFGFGAVISAWARWKERGKPRVTMSRVVPPYYEDFLASKNLYPSLALKEYGRAVAIKRDELSGAVLCTRYSPNLSAMGSISSYIPYRRGDDFQEPIVERLLTCSACGSKFLLRTNRHQSDDKVISLRCENCAGDLELE